MSGPPLTLQTSPIRPKHMSNRSITEITTPSFPKIHRHHHHHHHHLHKSKDEPQSAHPSSHSWSLRNEGEGSSSMPASRRESVLVSGSGDDRQDVGGAKKEGERQRIVKEGELEREKEMGVMRASELRNAITELNTLSNANTRRLDTTYYSVLEKLSALQSTITSLKELADLARSLDSEFKEEAAIVETEVTAQLDSFNNFDDQESRILDLQKRVEVGREKIRVLGERTEMVKERVEGWERAEQEWQGKMRNRMRVIWIVGTVVVALIGTVWFFYPPGATDMHEGRNGTVLNSTGLLGKIPDMESVRKENGVLGKIGEMVDVRNRSWRFSGVHGDMLEELRNRDVKGKEDQRLRVFDEL